MKSKIILNKYNFKICEPKISSHEKVTMAIIIPYTNVWILEKLFFNQITQCAIHKIWLKLSQVSTTLLRGSTVSFWRILKLTSIDTLKLDKIGEMFKSFDKLSKGLKLIYFLLRRMRMLLWPLEEMTRDHDGQACRHSSCDQSSDLALSWRSCSTNLNTWRW